MRLRHEKNKNSQMHSFYPEYILIWKINVKHLTIFFVKSVMIRLIPVSEGTLISAIGKTDKFALKMAFSVKKLFHFFYYCKIFLICE